jgi:tRNA(Ile)-lysidine synthase
MTIRKKKPVPPDPLAAQVARTLRRHAMVIPGDKVLVGVSGGPDSMALAHLLDSLAPDFELRLGLAHLDHGLRPESAEAEAALVCAFARRLGLACHTGKIETLPGGGSLEEQLRRRRYAFFQELATQHGYAKVAVGHHADDNAEAVLLHLLRGSGNRGLAGIPPVRPPGILRPLIAARRSEILAYLQRHGIDYVRDPSNADLGFERNRVRHQLLPLLSQGFNPNLVPVLNRTAMICWEEECWLEAHLQPCLVQAIEASDAGRIELRVERLAAWPRPMQRRILRMALRQWQGHLRRLGAEHVEALIALLAPGKRGRRLHLPVRLTAERTETLLRFRHEAAPRSARPAEGPAPYHYLLPWPLPLPLTLEIPAAECRLHFSMVPAPQTAALKAIGPGEILLDPGQLMHPLSVRCTRPGDRLRPYGLGGRQKLKALFANRKIGRQHRGSWPLLLCGSEIVWVVGLRRSDAAPVSPATGQALRVQAEALDGGAIRTSPDDGPC